MSTATTSRGSRPMADQHLDEELLHRYFDRDLNSDQRAEVETHLQRCPACGARLGELQTLRGQIARAAEASAREVDFDALFGRIEQGIARSKPAGTVERLSVWRKEQADQRPARLWASAAGLLAAAAAALLLVRAGLGLPGGAPESSSIDIEQVAFNDDYGGTVFQVAVADGVSTQVVWINDYDDGDDSEEAIQ